MIDGLVLPVGLAARESEVLLRRATADDLYAIMRLLAEDPVSAGRGDVASDEDVDVHASTSSRGSSATRATNSSSQRSAAARSSAPCS